MRMKRRGDGYRERGKNNRTHLEEQRNESEVSRVAPKSGMDPGSQSMDACRLVAPGTPDNMSLALTGSTLRGWVV